MKYSPDEMLKGGYVTLMRLTKDSLPTIIKGDSVLIYFVLCI